MNLGNYGVKNFPGLSGGEQRVAMQCISSFTCFACLIPFP